jgi:hypothetical protein
MTPEQRLERLERVAKLFVAAGLRARKQSREQAEKINILIHSQIETGDVVRKTSEQLRQTDEQLRSLGSRHEQEMAELRNSQKLTDQALRAFIDSLRKGRNGARSD